MESSGGSTRIVMNQQPGGESNRYNRSQIATFEAPDLHSVAQESASLKIARFAMENTETLGVFFIRNKKWRCAGSQKIFQKKATVLK